MNANVHPHSSSFLQQWKSFMPFSLCCCCCNLSWSSNMTDQFRHVSVSHRHYLRESCIVHVVSRRRRWENISLISRHSLSIVQKCISYSTSKQHYIKPIRLALACCKTQTHSHSHCSSFSPLLSTRRIIPSTIDWQLLKLNINTVHHSGMRDWNE